MPGRARRWTARHAVLLVTGLLAAGLPAMLSGTPSALANHLPYTPGDVFVGVGLGKVLRFTPTGTLVEVLNSSGSGETTGMCFDGAGNLRSTNFLLHTMTLFDNQGGVVQSPWAGPFNANPESCVVDAAGNVYVGQASGTRDVLKFNPAGAALASYDVAVQNQGADWIDLAADQKTLYYTSEGNKIKRYDVSTYTQLPDLATASLGCYALRIRANGEVLAACNQAVARFSATGSLLQSYSASSQGLGSVFALDLDPDGLSFWTADPFSPKVVRVNIATGAQVATFNTGVTGGVRGLVVYKGRFGCASPISPTMSGTAGNDVLLGTPGNDVIGGMAGNDVIHGNGGNDVILAGDGNDVVTTGSGNDLICGGPGADVISGGDGGNRIEGGDGDDIITAGNGGDLIFGDAGKDSVAAGNGNDLVVGGAGNDSISGGNGDNRLEGGDGNDTLVGGSAADTSFGDLGNDLLIGSGGANTHDGGPGADTCLLGTTFNC